MGFRAVVCYSVALGSILSTGGKPQRARTLLFKEKKSILSQLSRAAQAQGAKLHSLVLSASPSVYCPDTFQTYTNTQMDSSLTHIVWNTIWERMDLFNCNHSSE